METLQPEAVSIEALTERVEAILAEAGDLLASARIGVAQGRVSPETFLYPEGAIMRAELFADGTRVILFVKPDETLSDGVSRPTELIILLDDRAMFRLGDTLPADIKSRLGGDSFQMVTVSNCQTAGPNRFPADGQHRQKAGFCITVKHRFDDDFLALRAGGLNGGDNFSCSDDPASNLARMAFLRLIWDKIGSLQITATNRQGPVIFQPGLGGGDPGDHDGVRAVDAATGRPITAGVHSGALAIVTDPGRNKID